MENREGTKVPSNNQHSNQEMDIHTIQTTVHKGPLPDPYTFEQYDKVVPGLRIGF